MKRTLAVTFVPVCLLLASCGKKEEDKADTGAQQPAQKAPEPVLLRIGHGGHDHHTALYVAADNAGELATATGIGLRGVEDQGRYELYDGEKKLADVELIIVGTGASMPQSLAQGLIDVGLGGVAPVLIAADSGAPIKLLAPLHSNGDLFVVGNLPVASWDEFVTLAKSAGEPIRIGYEDDALMAGSLFQSALEHAALTCTDDAADTSADVLLIPAESGGQLNESVAQGQIDGYIGTSPYPTLGADTGVVRIVSDLASLPPGEAGSYPCCCIAASNDAIATKGRAVEAFLTLMSGATRMINENPAAAISAASRWSGVSEGTEAMSIAAGGFSVDPSPQWRQSMGLYVGAMNDLGLFTGAFVDQTEQEVGVSVYDLSLLQSAQARLSGG